MPAIKRPQAAGSGRHLSTAEKLARRDAAVKQILLLLANEPMSAADVGDELGLHRSTAFAHLHHMAGEHLVRRSGKLDDRRRELWELGDERELAVNDEPERGFVAQRPVAPAQQVGMPRDPLVAAMFGKPQGAAA